MISAELLGLLLTCAFVGVCCLVVLKLRLSAATKQLLCVAVMLRLIGTQIYYATFSWSSYGGGDYGYYFNRGVAYANVLAHGEFGLYFNPTYWAGGDWYGTQFVFFVVSIVVSVIGPSLRGAFVVFAMMGLIGLIAFAVAFQRAAPDIPVKRYLAWLLLFPSLWFWPAAIGKDAVLLMGLGLSVLGYVGKNGRIQWLFLAVGVFFVYAIRPEVAAVVVVSIVVGHLISGDRAWGARRVFQTVAIAALGLFLVQRALASIGAIGFDAEGVGAYVSDRAANSARGGSIVTTGTGAVGVLMGLGNVLFRPLPWEVDNFATLVASLEIWGFWLLLWLHRKNAILVVKQFRSSRLAAMGVPFVLLYATSFGLAIANLGIIARQRIYLFPFLFLLFVEMQRRVRPSLARRPSTTGISRSLLVPSVGLRRTL